MKRIHFPGPYRYNFQTHDWEKVEWSPFGRGWYSPGNKANWAWKGHWGIPR